MKDLKRIIIKFLKKLGYKRKKRIYDFNKSNPLGNSGERVDFKYSIDFDIDKLDIYQLNHLKRYEFANNYLSQNIKCADFACGTGYGSILLSKNNRIITAIDIDTHVIKQIKKRYKSEKNVDFICLDLLNIEYENIFDAIVSFETIEHFHEDNIIYLLKLYSKALKQNGKLIFSVPYMQEESEQAKKMGFHLTFNIDENKIKSWARDTGFEIRNIWYQNYDTHIIQSKLNKIDFIICHLDKRND